MVWTGDTWRLSLGICLESTSCMRLFHMHNDETQMRRDRQTDRQKERKKERKKDGTTENVFIVVKPGPALNGPRVGPNP